MTKLQLIKDEILESSSKAKLSEMPLKVKMEKINTAIKSISQDVGIQRVTEYQSGRMFEFLNKWKPNLTVQNFYLAFELLALGKLDKFLPEVNGKHDRNHYQMFSVEYVCKILDAFKRLEDTLTIDPGKMLTEPKKKKSPDQIKKERKIVHLAYKSMILKEFRKLKEDKKHNIRFIRSRGVIELLTELELIEEIKKPGKKQVREALSKIVDNKILNQFTRETAKRSFQTKRIDGYLLQEAEAIHDNKQIMKLFKRLIREKKDLNEYLKIME